MTTTTTTPPVKLGQRWRRTDPSGTSEEFRIQGFQRSSFNDLDTVARGKTRSGKIIKVSTRLLTSEPERFTLIEDVVGPVPTAEKKPRAKYASEWTHPVGTPVLLTLDDGTVVPTKTRSRAWQLGRNGVIKLEHPHSPWCLTRVRLDKSRMLGNQTAEVLGAICRATEASGVFQKWTPAELRIMHRLVREGSDREGRKRLARDRCGFRDAGHSGAEGFVKLARTTNRGGTNQGAKSQKVLRRPLCSGAPKNKKRRSAQPLPRSAAGLSAGQNVRKTALAGGVMPAESNERTEM